MVDDRKARPSLLLAGHERAHREHRHQHQIFHNKRQAATVIESVVTEVVATISVVQQINVDSNGHTISIIQTLFTPSSSDAAPATAATTTDAYAPSTTADRSPIDTTDPGPAATSTTIEESSLSPAAPPQSFPPSQSIDPATTSAPSTTSFASFIITSNSTTLISSSSSSSGFSNSSTSSTSLSSSSSRSSSSLSSSTIDDAFFAASTSYYSPTPSLQATAAPPAGLGGTGAPSSPSSTSASGNGSSNSSSAQSTPVIVGGVVGSIAGAAILIFLLMFLVRWKKRHQSMLSLSSGDAPASSETTRGGASPTEPSGGMIERTSRAFAMPAAAFSSLAGYKRSSQKTEQTISSTEGSERGFYRVSGRKLPSVFQHGGDGYGGAVHDTNTLGGSSFYRDSQGFYGGLGSPTSTSAPRDRDSGIPVMRPSPARTPVTEHAFSYPAVPAPLGPLPRRPDVLGRSHPSQDGSHASRFTEEV